jgi:hypothetical protein
VVVSTRPPPRPSPPAITTAPVVEDVEAVVLEKVFVPLQVLLLESSPVVPGQLSVGAVKVQPLPMVTGAKADPVLYVIPALG